MDEHTGDWQDQSSEDLSGIEIEIEYHPLAQLACDLALSTLYIEQNIGGWCDECTCVLKYHCSDGPDEDCELCMCSWQHIRPLPVLVSSPTFKLRRNSGGDGFEGRPQDSKSYRVQEARERERVARKVLRELTE